MDSVVRRWQPACKDCLEVKDGAGEMESGGEDADKE